MKKICWIMIACICFFVGNEVKANSISSITMDIYIDQMGTAHVKETWESYLNEGTEGYKPYYNLGSSVISNFKVYDNGNLYTMLSSWNPSASFGEKAYKNGINYISNGVELCFGISEYGSHTYVLEYDISNFVAGLMDADMVYWTLMPYDFSVEPNNVYIKIYADEKFEDTLDVWGYGNYGGYAYVYDGYIEMNSNGILDSNEYMTILIKFPKGTFNTDNNKLNYDFNHYLDMAEEGAEHYTDNGGYSYSFRTTFQILFMVAFGFIMIIMSVVFAAQAIIKNMSEGGAGALKLMFGETGKKIPKDVPLYRDIPCNKDIFRAYWVAVNYGLMKRKTDLLGAILLKWLREGKIRTEKIESGILKKEQNIIIFDQDFFSSNTLENDLYQMMFEASKDGKLEQNEFKKWCNTHYNQILKWFDKVADKETEKLVEEGKIDEAEQITFKFFKSKVYNVHSSMLEEAKKMKGLKNFLEEFSQIDKREAIEVMMWEEYLMYAQIFGIADKVAKQFKKLYPDVITDYSYDSVIFVHTISYTGMQSATSAKSRAESYSSGGGGFSSGGGGGGSFGGGGGGGGFR